jgi:hypothetical protein
VAVGRGGQQFIFGERLQGHGSKHA